jgi:hypothetical protein
MPTMKTVLWMGALAAGVFAVLRMAMDGPGGETIAALTLVAGCVLFAGGAIVDRLDRLISSRPKNE